MATGKTVFMRSTHILAQPMISRLWPTHSMTVIWYDTAREEILHINMYST